MPSECNTPLRDVKRRIETLFDELFRHDGYGELKVEMRILKRGQKEIILHCGKQHRYVVDYRPEPEARAGVASDPEHRDG